MQAGRQTNKMVAFWPCDVSTSICDLQTWRQSSPGLSLELREALEREDHLRIYHAGEEDGWAAANPILQSRFAYACRLPTAAYKKPNHVVVLFKEGRAAACMVLHTSYKAQSFQRGRDVFMELFAAREDGQKFGVLLMEHTLAWLRYRQGRVLDEVRLNVDIVDGDVKDAAPYYQKLGFQFAEEHHPAFRFDAEREKQLVLRRQQNS